ncbi:hypothetical protein KC19_4G169700 [Ceratodon purpureus]|uniref:Uncharacterized protein n=1 Tax=Ceratodon purpureus TaxID=3225 RepID=A0A8T0ID55_CERPU|nr:hypothetical protein KC19_4G169700 [Ceratodon purpureus]
MNQNMIADDDHPLKIHQTPITPLIKGICSSLTPRRRQPENHSQSRLGSTMQKRLINLLVTIAPLNPAPTNHDNHSSWNGMSLVGARGAQRQILPARRERMGNEARSRSLCVCECVLWNPNWE